MPAQANQVSYTRSPLCFVKIIWPILDNTFKIIDQVNHFINISNASLLMELIFMIYNSEGRDRKLQLERSYFQ